MLNTKLSLMLLVLSAVGLLSIQCNKSLIRKRKPQEPIIIDFKIVNVPLTRNKNVFLADISLGTPAQNFKVAIDPEKNDFWLMSPACTSLLCQSRNIFDSTKSSTFKNEFTQRGVIYRDLSTVDGEIGTDVLILGKNKIGQSIKVENQSFIHATELTGFTNEPYDGLLGVAYTDEEISFRDFTTPLENWVNADPTNNVNIFSFMVSGNDGTLVLGGIDTSIKADSIKYVNLNQKGVWNFDVSRLMISELEVNPHYFSFSLDSTISFIGVPSDLLNEIASYLDATMVEDKLVVVCSLRNSNENIEFVVSGKKFSISPMLYIDNNGKDECTLNMRPIPENYWVWGTPILEAFYIVFDGAQNRIGFANYN